MITIFTIPKSFVGEFKVIQENAIKSWLKLKPRPSIILCGNDEGVAAVARKYQCKHIPHIARSPHGTPLLNDVFKKAQQEAKTSCMAFVNTDIILQAGFMKTVDRAEAQFQRFLLSGQRYESRVDTNTLAHYSWADYFVFTRGTIAHMPSFAIGRTFWDKWLFYYAISTNTPIIDATATVKAIHQSHSYNHDKGGVHAVWEGEEARNNVFVAGGWGFGASLTEADYITRARRPYFIRKSLFFNRFAWYVKSYIVTLLYKLTFLEGIIFKLRFFSKSRLVKMVEKKDFASPSSDTRNFFHTFL